MRLADIYLMYAESCAAFGGSSAKSDNCTLTSLDAVNKIRTRCGAEGVHSSYIADNKKFMDEIRRERAVELSMEGFRFMICTLAVADRVTLYQEVFCRIRSGRECGFL